MQKLIAKSKEKVVKRIEVETDQKVKIFHKRLDALELRVLERPTLLQNLSFFRT